VAGRPRESARAHLGFPRTVRGGIPENGVGDTNTAGKEAREAGPKQFGDTGSVAESGWRPEPTPRAYRGGHRTGQAPCYAVERTVSPVRILSPVRYIPAPRICIIS
jgi:hypothetical protein